jgi:hypothetical protein
MRNLKLIFLIMVVFTLAIISACSTQNVTIEKDLSLTPTIATGLALPTQYPSPMNGKTSVVGQVISSRTGNPLANTPIRLAEVYRQGDVGGYVLDGAHSPGAMSEGQGFFYFKDINPGEYVVVVGDAMDVYKVITDASDKARIYKAEANKILNLDVLKVDLGQ